MKDEWTRDEIEALADPRSFQRGSGYQRDGRVEITKRSAGRVDAVVRGTIPYSVELRRDPRMWSCTCPVGEDGVFCKHCVAVALDVAVPAPTSRSSRRATPVDEDIDIRSFVTSLDHEALVELAMEQTDADWQLRERLRAQAIAAAGGTVNIREWKLRIDAAFGGRRFVPYAEAGSWAHEVCDVIDALDDMRAAGHAAAVVLLVEHANRRADEAVQHVDDSVGWLTDISERLAQVHLRACLESQPEPVALAQRLADFELRGELDTFRRAAATYAHVLGPTGLAEYRRIVEPKWRAARTSKDPYSHVAFASTQAMIGIAQGVEDPDELIAIRVGDLRSPYDYLEIAEALLAADRQDDALTWACRGLEAFADRQWQTPPLREFAAGQLRAGGDRAGAEALWWEAFERHPSIDGYRKLLAESADTEARRQQAIDILRQRFVGADTEARTRNPLLERAPATTLVEILLYEGRADDAWDVASTHGCDDRIWMTLARAREADHPLDVIPIYARAAVAQIDTKKNGGYRTAVELLARIRTLATNADVPQRFTDLLTTVTTDHARKRNLMALIDKKGWR